MQQPFFSIVIPTLNEEKYLPLLLVDLSKQEFDDFEVIIVDGNSEDKTIQKTQPYKKTLTLKTFVVKKRNVSYQRNYGAKKTKGEWIVFMDADNRIKNSFLQNIKTQLNKNPETDLFTTFTKPDRNILLENILAQSINTALLLLKWIGKPGCPGALIGIRKTMLSTLQFDESRSILEDSWFVREGIQRGYTFTIFKYPRYFFSFRRQRKNPIRMNLHSLIVINYNLFFKKNFIKTLNSYPMKGGRQYA